MLDTRSPASPYLLDRPPISSGRTLLAVAFEHYCMLAWGLSGEDIAAAFDETASTTGLDRERVTIASGLIGRLLADGVIKSFARPIGGGEPIAVKTTSWELDDFSRRFAASGLNATAPFDASAKITHWVFVDTADFNQVLEASFGDDLPRGQQRGPKVTVTRDEPDRAATCKDRLMRMPEVERLTGMSRSTIYERIRAGLFPKGIYPCPPTCPLGANPK